jgi:hypothetical protein
MKWSPTSIGALLDCQAFVGHRYLSGLPEAPPARERAASLRVGTFAHEVLRHAVALLMDRDQAHVEAFAEDAVAMSFQEALRFRKAPTPTEAEEIRETVTDYLVSEAAKLAHVVGVEVEWDFEEQGITFAGRADRVDCSPDGDVTVIDYKWTGSWSPIRDDEQALLTLVGMAECFPFYRSIIFKRYSLTRDDSSYLEWEQELDTEVRQWAAALVLAFEDNAKAGKLRATVGDRCSSCPGAASCHYFQKAKRGEVGRFGSNLLELPTGMIAGRYKELGKVETAVSEERATLGDELRRRLEENQAPIPTEDWLVRYTSAPVREPPPVHVAEEILCRVAGVEEEETSIRGLDPRALKRVVRSLPKHVQKEVKEEMKARSRQVDSGYRLDVVPMKKEKDDA